MILWTSLLCASSAFGGPSPIAEVLCDSTERMRDKLLYQFGTQQLARGVRGPEQVMEVWTDERGDWTLVITYAGGTSCIVAMGEHWQQTLKDPA
ncbi:MAG: hypothetical protein AAGF79_20715 [Pseudomonadota bacterium]